MQAGKLVVMDGRHHGVLKKLLLESEVGVLLLFQLLAKFDVVHFQKVLFLCYDVDLEHKPRRLLLRTIKVRLLLHLDTLLVFEHIRLHLCHLNPQILVFLLHLKKLLAVKLIL